READDGLGRALARGIRTTVMVVVTREVLRALPTFAVDLVKRHPTLAGITLFPVGVGPAGTQKPGSVISPLSSADVREMVLAVALLHAARIPIGIGAYPIVNPMLRALGIPTAELYQCTAGRGRACVHADQTVSTCHPVKEPVYGKWRPGLLRELGDVAAHARLGARDFDGCSDCGHREECGHCRAFVTATGAPLFGND